MYIALMTSHSEQGWAALHCHSPNLRDWAIAWIVQYHHRDKSTAKFLKNKAFYVLSRVAVV